jgi:hypothetical protein
MRIDRSVPPLLRAIEAAVVAPSAIALKQSSSMAARTTAAIR